ncbi:hypothetical protein [Epinotia aporema granulovirus]|uniref:Uncharacterized protein n=1 Tax=Epinotia aporema granulovirus TaxID=166056 RepID=K4EQU5_9BBAC|nr:hypothetical protein [Epinotia aporema granulovirus]AER41546.1 hypothetical protein [Epinotia aporema granulovirus]
MMYEYRVKNIYNYTTITNRNIAMIYLLLLITAVSAVDVGLFTIAHRPIDITLRSAEQYVNYVPNDNGDRLRLHATNSIMLTLYRVNSDSFLLKTYNYNDVMCLDKYGEFKLLTTPNAVSLPNDCFLSTDAVIDEHSYYLDNDTVCIDEPSINTRQYKFYAIRNNKKYYLTITSTHMSATYNEKLANIFSIQYSSCIPKIDTNGWFVCRIQRKRDDCQGAVAFAESVHEWMLHITPKATTAVTAETDIITDIIKKISFNSSASKCSISYIIFIPWYIFLQRIS